MDHFQKATANRHQHDQFNNPSLSAVNAVALSGDIPWEESYRILLNQGKRYGLMLTDRKCVDNMLKEAGYVRIPGVRRMADYSTLSDYLLSEYPHITHAIVLTVKGAAREKRFCAVYRMPDSESGFVVQDIKEEPRSVIALWLDYREIRAKKPAVDLPVMHSEGIIHPSHPGYLYYQPNPLKNNIGDCVIRAYSAVFDQPWDKVLEMLAQSCEYTDTALNDQFTYRSLTSEYEFDPYTRPVFEGKGLTGVEFCKRLDLVCRNGERFFAKLGPTHVVGIVPAVINGVKQYAIADSWDSSSRKVGDYWIFRPAKRRQAVPEKVEEKAPVLSLNAGDKLIHPAFGEGVIQSFDPETDRIQILFPTHGEKLLTRSWIRANCRQSGDG